MSIEPTFTEKEFAAYFREMHGHDPFRWQTELLRRVLSERRWPDTLALPTAAGKTAVVDVALFVLAAQTRLPATERTAPRRLVFVVDRRVVVNATFARAERIRDRLAKAEGGILRQLRDALLACGGEEPLRVTELRGGMWKDERWARTPLQPAVIVSTVDQIGSRLLHRGYGLSPNAWPLHAGLLANDALIILDEAHLSRPFAETLAAIRDFRAHGRRPLSLPFAVVAMSATPGRDAGRTFPGGDDVEFISADPALTPRLTRPKWVMTADPGRDFVTACADNAKALANQDGRDAIAVVVNTVDAARKVYARLAEGRDRAAGEVILLTGRCRAVERDRLVKRYENRLLSGRDRAANPGKLFVVATQCIEAGADFDFDALVTACCPLDCLRQRLGRLNRIGDLEEAVAVVMGPENAQTDYLYGDATANTWKLLQELETTADGKLDFSPVAIAPRLPGDLSPYNAPTAAAPLLFPAYCNLWAQTNPEPFPSPDPAAFLHGPERATAEVQLVWRADLDPERPETWAEAVKAFPPLPGEALSVHLWVARAWLGGKSGKDAGVETDIEGAAPPKDDSPGAGRAFLRWRGEDTEPPSNDLAAIRPGDTLIVPSAWGGCDEFGWNPDCDSAVADLADAARQAAKRAPILRLDPGVVGEAAMVRFAPAFATAADDADDGVGFDHDALSEALRAVGADDAAPTWLRDAAAVLAKAKSLTARKRGDGVWLVSGGAWSTEQGCFEDSLLATSTVQATVTIATHTKAVAEKARHFADSLGLPSEVCETMRLAGLWHDQGKRDPRFQALLCGGDRAAAIKAELRLGDMLAKSPIPAYSQTARAESAYPQGARHELLSVRLAEDALRGTAQEGGDDLALLLHLIGSHHGRCRAFAPAVADPSPLTVECEVEGHAAKSSTDTGLEKPGSGVAERFWRLIGDYGWWGLAYLESVFRLADHRVSENEEGENA